MPNTEDLKGRAKEAAGALTGDESLKNEGRIDQAAAKVKDAVDSVKEKAADVAEKIEARLRETKR
jgi:uncharacterized protein YjbJ (UPF0337 family)